MYDLLTSWEVKVNSKEQRSNCCNLHTGRTEVLSIEKFTTDQWIHTNYERCCATISDAPMDTSGILIG